MTWGLNHGEERWLLPLKVCERLLRARFGACGGLRSVKNT